MSSRANAAALRTLAALKKKKDAAKEEAEALTEIVTDIIGLREARKISRRSVARIRRAIHADLLPGHAHGVNQPVHQSEFTSKRALEAWTLADAPFEAPSFLGAPDLIDENGNGIDL